MVKLTLLFAGIIAFAYWKRHGFRRAWYILRTGAENPDWEALGGDYFLASWEKRRRTKSVVKEEAKASSSGDF